MVIEADTIHNGDCLELMRLIPDNSIDCIICDLPYGCTGNKWDTVIPFDKLWEQYNRIAKEHTPIILFGKGVFSAELIMSNKDNYRYTLIWSKPRGQNIFSCNKMPMCSHEDILIFYRKLPTYNVMKTEGKAYSMKRCGKSSLNLTINQQELTSGTYEGRFPLSVLNYSMVCKGKHPTQKPVDLIKWLIKAYTNENDIVLDNCMGVGSTCVAAKETNRRYIGIELDTKFYEIAKERLL